MFTWLIEDFKYLQDRRIQSQEFHAGGCRWCLLFYPNGREGNNSVSLFLCVGGYQDLPRGWKITAKFCFGIEKDEHVETRVVRGGLAIGEICFSEEIPAWGSTYWFHHSELDDGYVVNGNLKIVAEVEVLDKSNVETPEELEDPFCLLSAEENED